MFKYLTIVDMRDFFEGHPQAARWLLERHLINERAYLQRIEATTGLNDWQQTRIEELRVLAPRREGQ